MWKFKAFTEKLTSSNWLATDCCFFRSWKDLNVICFQKQNNLVLCGDHCTGIISWTSGQQNCSLQAAQDQRGCENTPFRKTEVPKCDHLQWKQLQVSQKVHSWEQITSLQPQMSCFHVLQILVLWQYWFFSDCRITAAVNMGLYSFIDSVFSSSGIQGPQNFFMFTSDLIFVINLNMDTANPVVVLHVFVF